MPLRHSSGFRTPFEKNRHYQEHVVDGGEFPHTSADEYEEKADEFLGKPLTPTTKTYTRKNGARAGDMLKWDTATDEYVVLRNDGYIRTYFILDYEYGTNQEYWDMQIRKDEESADSI